MKPASALWPERAAKSIVLRSIATNMAPRNTYTGISTTRPAAASRARRAGLTLAPDAARVPPDGAGPTWSLTTAGSVDRCDANHSEPARAHSAAVPAPAAGDG